MGWAKYAEDNYEIMIERQRLAESRSYEPIIKVSFKPETDNTKVIIGIKAKDNSKSFKEKEDQYLYCRSCGRIFTFPVKSQEYYESKGWDAPKRCKVCRELRKARLLMCSTH